MADSGALKQRLTLGPLLIVAVVVLFLLDAHLGERAPLLLVLALLLVLRSTWEYVDLLRAKSLEIGFPLLAGCAAAVVAANWTWLVGDPPAIDGHAIGRLGPAMITYALAVMVFFARALARFSGPGRNLETLGAQVLGLSYLAVFLGATVQLRWVARPELCYLPLASVVVVTKCGDTAAYFTGRALGGKKLCPLISPGKTWAGAWGALAGAALGGGLCLSLAPRWWDAVPAAWPWSIVYGIVIGTLGIVGDLAESLIKRDVGRKDSAPLLPGFGGLLDLLDSVIFVGPAALLFWLFAPLAK